MGEFINSPASENFQELTYPLVEHDKMSTVSSFSHPSCFLWWSYVVILTELLINFATSPRSNFSVSRQGKERHLASRLGGSPHGLNPTWTGQPRLGVHHCKGKGVFRDEYDHIPDMLAKFLDSKSINQAKMEDIQGQAMPCMDQPGELGN